MANMVIRNRYMRRVLGKRVVHSLVPLYLEHCAPHAWPTMFFLSPNSVRLQLLL